MRNMIEITKNTIGGGIKIFSIFRMVAPVLLILVFLFPMVCRRKINEDQNYFDFYYCWGVI